jgi:putative redox protein
MPTFTASAHSINGTPRHEVDVNGRHTLTTDQPHSYGGSDAGPSPHELVAATLASCASTMIVLYAQRKDWQLDGVQVDVDYDADATPRSIQTTVHLQGRLTDAQTQRLLRVADTCPVKRALEAGFAFRQRLANDFGANDNRAPAARGTATALAVACSGESRRVDAAKRRPWMRPQTLPSRAVDTAIGRQPPR